MTTTILGLSGSLRRASFNAGLLRAAAQVAPNDVTIDIGSIADVPLYNGDVEAADGPPDSVLRLRRQLIEADGLLLVTPEYNNGIPGVFKNAIDWISSGPDGMRAFSGKPVAVIGASPSGLGTVNAQTHWLQVLRVLETRPWFEGRLMVSGARGKFDENGDLTDEKTRERLKRFVEGFAANLVG